VSSLSGISVVRPF